MVTVGAPWLGEGFSTVSFGALSAVESTFPDTFSVFVSSFFLSSSSMLGIASRMLVKLPMERRWSREGFLRCSCAPTLDLWRAVELSKRFTCFTASSKSAIIAARDKRQRCKQTF